ncbi:hypothetical protein GCM10010191_56400 [Actinomadura vinacea]|uniref:DUF6286 domain-containing protein n=1 Tax=Actinomadura vinacea TaxID=115336 RepID=A0ABN3JQ27_9ACTN
MTTHARPLPGGGTGEADTHPPRRAAPARAADRAARRAFHSRRVVPALVAALLVTAAGVLTAIEVISALAGSPARLVPYERVASWATGARYKDWAPLLIAAGLALLGLVFLVAGLRPGRGRLVPLHGDDPDLIVGITRSGLRNAAGAAALGVDGVFDVARVKVGRRKVEIVLTSALRDPGDLGERVRAAVQRRLDELGPMTGGRAVVNVRRK